MGNAFGNLFALIIIVITAGISYFNISTAMIIFVFIAFGMWLMVWLADVTTRPSSSVPLAGVLSENEFDIYRKYHIFLWVPVAANAYSALLNLLRLSGVVWAGIAFWNESYWLGGLLVAYFFLTGGVCVRFDPALYLTRSANSGNDVARQELILLQSVEEKRYIYNEGD